MELKSKIDTSINNDFPFVLFRKPCESKVNGLFQINSEISVLEEEMNPNGFVFAPFNNQDSGYIIKDSFSEKATFSIDSLGDSKSSFDVISNQEKEHLSLIKKAIHQIKTSEVKKIVVSRKELLKMDVIEIESLFSRLLNQYPNAFVYCWFHPKSGLWMGATPERLLHVKDATFEVMALASTQEYKGSLDVEWGEKEKTEHQIVVDYIAENLKEYNLKISETYTVKAGNLLHLRADIKGKVNSENTIKNLVSLIHPTPATCGLPKEDAKQFVLKSENYNREFYTGYLGEISENNSDLFVNLRCMKIDSKSKSIAVYVGGGITKDSIPEKEWLETVAKSKVMKSIL